MLYNPRCINDYFRKKHNPKMHKRLFSKCHNPRMHKQLFLKRHNPIIHFIGLLLLIDININDITALKKKKRILLHVKNEVQICSVFTQGRSKYTKRKYLKLNELWIKNKKYNLFKTT